MQNFINLAQANLANADAKEDAPWYVKYGARGFGTIAGGMAMLMGALNTITSILDPICIVFSIWQIVLGFGVITIESPCCCFFVDHVQTISQKIESKPLWIKAAIYVGAPLPTLFFCFGFATFFGSGLIVGAGVMYGFMALGKKASRSEMAQNAISQQQQQQQSNTYFNNPLSSMFNKSSNSSSDKSNLVENLKDPVVGGSSDVVLDFSDPFIQQQQRPGSQGQFVGQYQNQGPPPAYSPTTTYNDFTSSSSTNQLTGNINNSQENNVNNISSISRSQTKKEDITYNPFQ